MDGDDIRLLEDKTVVASIRLAGGCEGSHDLVDAGFKLGDRELCVPKTLSRFIER